MVSLPGEQHDTIWNIPASNVVKKVSDSEHLNVKITVKFTSTWAAGSLKSPHGACKKKILQKTNPLFWLIPFIQEFSKCTLKMSQFEKRREIPFWCFLHKWSTVLNSGHLHWTAHSMICGKTNWVFSSSFACLLSGCLPKLSVEFSK